MGSLSLSVYNLCSNFLLMFHQKIVSQLFKVVDRIFLIGEALKLCIIQIKTCKKMLTVKNYGKILGKSKIIKKFHEKECFFLKLLFVAQDVE